MKHERRNLILSWACLCTTALCASGQVGLTYQWSLEHERYGSWGKNTGIAADSNRVYVASGNMIAAYSKRGELQWQKAVGSTQAGDAALYGGYLYILQSGYYNYLRCMTTNGVEAWQSNQASALKEALGLCVDAEYLYVADTGNYRIRVYDRTSRALVRTFGSQGTLMDQFSSPNDVAIDGDDLYVVDAGNGMMKVFSRQGVFKRAWAVSTSTQSVCVDRDYLYTRVGTQVAVYHKDGTLVSQTTSGTLSSTAGGIAAEGDHLYTVATWGLRFFGPIYRTLGRADFNRLPRPTVVNVLQRRGTQIVDIDYVVNDADTSRVTVYAGAFVDRGAPFSPNLANYAPMRTFIEGTASNTGSNVTAGSTHRLSWNMQADGVEGLISEYGQLRVAVMAQDNRGLMDLHFLHVPAMGANPAFTINRAPIRQQDLLPLWFWLTAAGNADISLTAGSVHGVGGGYDGQLLASGTNTTAAGRNYLLGKLGVREATATEIGWAREGTTAGSVTQWEPLRTPPPPGSRVNELTFVTSPTNGWWVVPLAP